MKLSTYAIKLRGMYKNPLEPRFLCILNDCLSIRLCLKTKSKKLKQEYNTYNNLVRKYINKSIEESTTVTSFLYKKGVYTNIYLKSEEFRLQLLNTMIAEFKKKEEKEKK